MNVNEKGVKGLIKVIDDLSDKQIYCFPAFDDHSPVDLVAMPKSGKCYRLQVKYREPMSNKKSERYELKASSVVNGKIVPIDRSLIDGWAVFLSQSKKVIYVPIEALAEKNSLIINPEMIFGELDELV